MPDRHAIASQALSLLGANTVDNFEAGTTEADLCRDLYEPTVRRLIEDHAWNFAETTASLARDASPAHPDFAYSYALPAQYIAARGLLDRQGRQSHRPYKIRGTRVCTDEVDPYLLYSYRAPEQAWPAYFVEALVWELASKLAGPLTEDRGKMADAAQMAAQRLSRARFRDSQKDTADRIDLNPLIAAHSD